jgi:O-antigen/teichoic acid export membrane protein
MARFASDVALTFGVRIVALLIGIATGIVVARILGPEGRGAYALIVAFPGLVLSFVHLGIAQANVYFLRKAEVKVDPAIIKANTVVLTIGISIVTLTALWFLKPVIFSSFLKDLPPKYYWIILMVVPFIILETFASSLLVANERFRLINGISFVLRIIETTSIVIVLMVLHMGLWGVALAFLGMSITSASTSTYFAFRGRPVISRPDYRTIGRSVAYGLKSHVQTLTGFLHFRVDIFILAAFLSTVEVGYYSVAVGLVSLIFFVPESVGFVLFPKLAGLAEKEANELAIRACRNTIFVAAMPALGILILGRIAIRIMYGVEFLPSCQALYLLLPGTLAMCVYMILSRYFTSKNKQQVTIVAGIVGLAINVGLNLVLIPRLGIAGAAVATTSSYSITAFLMLCFFVRESGCELLECVIVRRTDIAEFLKILNEGILQKVRA